MKIKSFSKPKKTYCLKVTNARNKFLEGVFPFSKEGKIQARRFIETKTGKYKITKSKV